MAEENQEPQATATTERGRKKTRVGEVVSDKMDKTIVVAVTRQFMHPKYRKFVRRQKRYQVHDPANECRPGDRVLIEETRPLSKNKRWKLKEIIEKAPVI
ncbi:30S ribosomal protein S17 [Bradymonas sediminis]|uniref:Small ribosomal subunit protein uS17 n=1 Tax=Bradymonas sediminis TaxID=1548548 RepID=A0A2Z4FGB2_9DELT|nr:30S ribosomal protein S17 [Bradymonas sediminis]AWV87991.1 30S ribosomal protein S17 [Bradymonas sediminis]TDP77115.1 SSU ribosomal protein S17P [Bradymonas sediminis]